MCSSDLADHVGGVVGVTRGRRIGRVYVTALDDPPGMRSWVQRQLSDATLEVMAYPGQFDINGVTFRCLWPSRLITGRGSDANNASVVLHVTSHGSTFLFPGDAEPVAQEAMLTSLGPVDVLKVAHHGSAYQSANFAARLRPRFAVISVGEDNDYGHPAPATIALYQVLGAIVLRTDRNGSVAFSVTPDGVVTAHGHT